MLGFDKKVRSMYVRGSTTRDKLMFLVLKNISKIWIMPFRDWGSATKRFAVNFEGKVQT